MALLIYSRSGAIREKWTAVLKDRWPIHHASTIKEILILLRRMPISTLLLHQQGVSGEELAEICRQRGETRVFVFSDRPDNRQGLTCLQLGCIGYANTHIAARRLVAALEAVESGLAWVGTSLMQYLIRGLATTGETQDDKGEGKVSSRFAELSDREAQIAALVGEGLSNHQIGERFAITERTVKAHLSAIYGKTGCKSRLSLALALQKP